MNSSQRIMAVLQGKPTDRRALIMTMSLYGARLTHCPLLQYYSDPAAYVRGQMAVKNTFDPDMLLAPFAFSLLGAAFGSKIKIFDNQPPNIVKPAIGSVDEFSSLIIPDINTSPELTYLCESLRLLVKECSGETPVAAFALSPMDLPALLMGVDGWLEALLFKQAAVEKILAVMTDHFIQWVNALFADGATCVILPVPFANLRIITPKIAEEICIPCLRKAFAQVSGPLILHHVGGPIQGSLKMLRNLPNVIGYCVDKKDNLAKARELIGPSAVLLGNLDGPGLLGRNQDDIYLEVSEMLKGQQDDPYYILATSSADIDLETPLENIQVIVDAVKSFGKGE